MSKTFDKLKGAVALALIVAGAYLAIAPRQAPLDLQPISGEPLQLKLEFAFPAARR
jgi:hypothetical protein